MPKYINADKIELKGISVFDQNLEILIPLSDVRKSLQMTPTADVKEVRHGRWDEIRDAYGKLEGWIHRDCGRYSMAKENYCPKCGAKMDWKE